MEQTSRKPLRQALVLINTDLDTRINYQHQILLEVMERSNRFKNRRNQYEAVQKILTELFSLVSAAEVVNIIIKDIQIDPTQPR